MRRLLVLFPVLGLLLLPALVTGVVTATPAAATTVNDVVAALRSDPVYVDPKAEVKVDAGRIREQIRKGSLRVYVAVLPAAAPTGVLSAIGNGLHDPAEVVLTVVGTTLDGGAGQQSGLRAGQAGALARAEQGGDTTDSLVAAIGTLQGAAGSGTSSSDGSSGSGSSYASRQSSGGGVLVPLLALLAVGGGGFLFLRSRRKKQAVARGLEEQRADVESLYGRLGSDVSSIDHKGDPVAQQALSDAAERYNAAGALMSKADTPGEFDAARRTLVEGLTAARAARTTLGLDPGPDIPPPPGTGPQMTAPGRVQVGQQEYDGSPQYAPGRPHYYGGGYLGGTMVPGGWYGIPFWETMLIGGALSGGFGGGGLFGGGYGGGGFERGYEEGREDARDDNNQDSGNGGGWGGGGDFGGGGGGWGGGGDFGGGGGDFGGGGDGGGSW